MALIVAKRRMADSTATDELLLGKSGEKKWLGTEAVDSRQTITIPDTPIERLKVVFPSAEDKVGRLLLHSLYRNFKRLSHVVTTV